MNPHQRLTPPLMKYDKVLCLSLKNSLKFLIKLVCVFLLMFVFFIFESLNNKNPIKRYIADKIKTKLNPYLCEIKPAIRGPRTHAMFETVYNIPSFFERFEFFDLSLTIIPKLVTLNVYKRVVKDAKITRKYNLVFIAKSMYVIAIRNNV